MDAKRTRSSKSLIGWAAVVWMLLVLSTAALAGVVAGDPLEGVEATEVTSIAQ